MRVIYMRACRCVLYVDIRSKKVLCGFYKTGIYQKVTYVIP